MSQIAMASEDKSSDISTCILVLPTGATTAGGQATTRAAADSSVQPSAERAAESREWTKDASKGMTDQFRQDSRATSATSSARYRAPRKLIVPWRARTEAASWLAQRNPAPASALLRSILSELRQRHLASGGNEISDRALVAQLLSLPLDQG